MAGAWHSRRADERELRLETGLPPIFRQTGRQLLHLHLRRQKGNLAANTMPMELQIIRAQEFIRLGARGHFDLKASKAALAEIAAACWKRGINQALLDLRALRPGPKPVFSPADLAALVKTFREIGFTDQQRLAVLYGSDPHRRARMFAFIAKLRGWKVQAFGDFEEALTWLSAEETKMKLPSSAQVIPVRQIKPVKASSKVKPAAKPDLEVKPPAGLQRQSVPIRQAGRA
jgi:hypothetical protein